MESHDPISEGGPPLLAVQDLAGHYWINSCLLKSLPSASSRLVHYAPI
jgi:hypothetical protein